MLLKGFQYYSEPRTPFVVSGSIFYSSLFVFHIKLSISTSSGLNNLFLFGEGNFNYGKEESSFYYSTKAKTLFSRVTPILFPS
jgi:hypothetical protein